MRRSSKNGLTSLLGSLAISSLAVGVLLGTVVGASRAAGAEERLDIDGTISGQPVHLALDTGSDGTVLFRHAAQRLRLKITKLSAQRPLKAGEVLSDAAEECDLSVGGTTLKTVFGVVDSPGNLPVDVDGVVSWLDLSNGVFCVDLERRECTFSASLPGDIGAWSKWRILPNASHLAFECPGGSDTARIGIDTGYSGGILLNAARWEQWHLAHSNQPTTLNASVVPGEGLLIRKVFRARNLTLGGLSFSDVPLSEETATILTRFENAEAVLGLFALHQFEVIIDIKHRFLYTLPIAHPRGNFDYNGLGAVFVPQMVDRGDALIAHVAPGSVADRAGVRDGDLLLKIGQLDVTKWRTDPNVLPLSRFFERPSGTKLALTLEREERQYDATVTLAELESEAPETGLERPGRPARPPGGRGLDPSGADATNTPTLLEVPLRLASDECNAALLGRECAIIWFASVSKVYTEEKMGNDILVATAGAKALGVEYQESQFRSPFRTPDHKGNADFTQLLPDGLEKARNRKARDIYLLSFWCTAARHFVCLVPLWKEPAQQDTARRWVTAPLENAGMLAFGYDSGAAEKLLELSVRSRKEPLDTFGQAGRFASDILEAQKALLLKSLTQEEAAMVIQAAFKLKAE